MSITLSEIELVSPNPAHFTDPYQWRVRLNVLEELKNDVEFKVVWIGSSSSNSFDEVLEECEVGPLMVGANEFVLEHNAPNWRLIPPEDLLSVTVVIIAVSYREQEFLRVGYYVNVAYDKDELHEEPPQCIQIDRLARNVLTARPTLVTKSITWDSEMDVGDSSMASSKHEGADQSSSEGPPQSSESSAQPGAMVAGPQK